MGQSLCTVHFPLNDYHGQQRILHRIISLGDKTFYLPDDQSALNLAAARLRHIVGTKWSTKRYLNMKLLEQRETDEPKTA